MFYITHELTLIFVAPFTAFSILLSLLLRHSTEQLWVVSDQGTICMYASLNHGGKLVQRLSDVYSSQCELPAVTIARPLLRIGLKITSVERK